jgi:protease-4
VQKLGNDFGVTWDTAKTNNFSDFETIARPKTPQELDLAQSRVDDLYNKFIQKVSDSRGIPAETVQGIAQGRVWAGDEAIGLKLVDEIGGLQQAIEYAADKAHLGSRYKVKEYPEQLNFAESLAQLLSNQQTPISRTQADPLTREFLKMKAELKSLQDFNDPSGMYARLPVGWEIK